MTEEKSGGSEEDADQARAVFNHDGAHERIAGSQQIKPDVAAALLRIVPRLPQALRERNAVPDERDRQHDPRGSGVSHRLAVGQLANGDGDGETAADEEGSDRCQKGPEESL